MRRILRIWPLYFLLLFFAVVFGRVYALAHVPRGAIFSFAFLVGNVWIGYHGWNVAWASPFWSLSVEEQFYAAVPAFLRVTGRKAMALSCVGVIVLAYIALAWLGAARALPLLGVWVNSFVQFQFFAAGCLLALWHTRSPISMRAWLRPLLFLSGLVAWWIATARVHMFALVPVPGWQLMLAYGLALAGTCGIFLGVLEMKMRIPGAITYLGKISYGLYLFHGLFLWLFLYSGLRSYLPPFHGAYIAASVCATIMTAMVSYRWIESPFLRLKRRFEKIHSRTV